MDLAPFHASFIFLSAAATVAPFATGFLLGAQRSRMFSVGSAIALLGYGAWSFLFGLILLS